MELEINELELEKVKLESESPTDYTEKLNILKTEIEKITAFNHLTSEMLSKLVEKVEIEENGTATIHYRFADPVSF